jgi:hypothetical protein
MAAFTWINRCWLVILLCTGRNYWLHAHVWYWIGLSEMRGSVI